MSRRVVHSFRRPITRALSHFTAAIFHSHVRRPLSILFLSFGPCRLFLAVVHLSVVVLLSGARHEYLTPCLDEEVSRALVTGHNFRGRKKYSHKNKLANELECVAAPAESPKVIVTELRVAVNGHVYLNTLC